MKIRLIIVLVLSFVAFQTTDAQWRNRYPQSNSGGHHVYLDGFDLPVMNSGCTDIAPSPVSKDILFASKGFLWILDESGVAKRITKTGSVDARPNWSNDGKKIVFIRDNSLDTVIVLKDLQTGEEKVLVDSKGMELDPIFSNDDKFVYYACSESGHFDLHKINISAKKNTKITTDRGLERLPVPVKGTNDLILLRKTGFSDDSFEYYDAKTKNTKIILSENFMSQASFDLANDSRTLVYAWPNDRTYEIRLTDLNKPNQSILLTKGNGLPLAPKFSANDKWVYFSQPNKNEYQEIKRISVHGGKIQDVHIKKWDWGTSTYLVNFEAKVDNKKETIRVHVKDEKGHPFFPKNITVHQEGQSGLVFFYISKNTKIEFPKGKYSLTAVKGFETEAKTINFTVDDKTKDVDVNLKRIWNARKNNWYASDNHFHVNYGGTSQLTPEDIIPELKGEGLDFGFPLVANLHNKLLDREWIMWERNEAFPMIQFGQETRSHFLGHLNVLATKELFWPWMWGPRYSVYGREDIPNNDVIKFAESNNGIAGYVHPMYYKDLMGPKGMGTIPIGLVADFVAGDAKMLEIACLWTDELATSNILYKLLSIGKPVVISAGADVMSDYYRTMAIGSARVYVKIEEKATIPSYIKNLKAGKSFVSSGPLVEFKVDGKEAGDVVKSKYKKVNFELNLHTPVELSKIEIICNSNIIKTITPKNKVSSTYKGSIEVPVGGWVLVRVVGDEDKVKWPVMESYAFAQTAPIWFNKIGSTEPKAKKSAATDLLKLLDASEKRLYKGYKEHPIPRLKEHFANARKKLNKMVAE